MTARKAAPDRVHQVPPIPATDPTMDLVDVLDLGKRYQSAQQRIEADRMIHKTQENHSRTQQAAKSQERPAGIPKPIIFLWGLLLGLMVAEAYQLAMTIGAI